MSSERFDVSVPATEIEVAEAINATDAVPVGTIRRLAFERDRLRDEKKSDAELFDRLGAMNHRLFGALKTIERASSLDEAKRLAKAAKEAEGLLT
jgi:hypothetical protein